MYTVTLSKRDIATLHWLADRGYDGGAREHATEWEEHDDGSATLSWDSAARFEVYTYVYGETDGQDGPDESFLSCCGSDTLASALWGIVEDM